MLALTREGSWNDITRRGPERDFVSGFPEYPQFRGYNLLIIGHCLCRWWRASRWPTGPRCVARGAWLTRASPLFRSTDPLFSSIILLLYSYSHFLSSFLANFRYTPPHIPRNIYLESALEFETGAFKKDIDLGESLENIYIIFSFVEPYG